MRELPPGSIVADIGACLVCSQGSLYWDNSEYLAGCGNGKYMGVNPNVAVLGMDRSLGLVSIAKDRGFEVRSLVLVALPCVCIPHHCWSFRWD